MCVCSGGVGYVKRHTHQTSIMVVRAQGNKNREKGGIEPSGEGIQVGETSVQIPPKTAHK